MLQSKAPLNVCTHTHTHKQATIPRQSPDQDVSRPQENLCSIDFGQSSGELAEKSYTNSLVSFTFFFFSLVVECNPNSKKVLTLCKTNKTEGDNLLNFFQHILN